VIPSLVMNYQQGQEEPLKINTNDNNNQDQEMMSHSPVQVQTNDTLQKRKRIPPQESDGLEPNAKKKRPSSTAEQYLRSIREARAMSLEREKDLTLVEEKVASLNSAKVNDNQIITPAVFFQNPRRRYIGDFEKNRYTEAHWQVLHYVSVWINYAIVDRHFHKNYAGLYLWSYGKSFGKTLLCTILSRMINCYWWVFEDEGWQQDWDQKKQYKCIIYNALNDDSLRFRQVEMHGDRQPIAVRRRNQKVCGHIVPETPFIVTSNVPPEELGYIQKNRDIDVWNERMLIVCVDNCPLFDLIEKIKREYNIVIREEPRPPALQYRRI